MALTAGSRLGPYEIAAQIGVGGMGEVYQATDTKLKRQVAIKVLPASVAANAERLARFQREAEVLASLNHPNIAAIYGLEDAGGTKALVMELVEGPTLADRIALGAIPVDEALPIAKQIAEALEAAHEQGIIHRDLKPANVKVRPDGTVKVLDFGLAKAMGPTGALSASQSMAPTITTPAMTQAGMILGTAAYMSPEQARGRATDKRTDIWSFGCVLYEMLSGRQTWGGPTVTDMIAAVVAKEPDFGVLPANLHPRIQELLRRCLEKDPRERVRDAGDVRIEIQRALADPRGEADQGPAQSRTPSNLGWVAALLMGLVLGAAIWVLGRPASPVDPAVSRFRVELPPGVRLADVNGSEVAISQDGTRLAILGTAPAGGLQVYLRDIDDLEARAVPDSEVQPMGTGLTPFFSPDGASLGFRTAEGLMRASLAGGPPVRLVDRPRAFFNAAWQPDGTIVYAEGGNGVFRLTIDGSRPPLRLTPEPEPGVFWVFPSLLPAGQVLLSEWRGTPPVMTAVLLDPGTLEMRPLINGARMTVFTSTGHLLFQRESTLMAVQFEPASATVRGDEVPVLQGVGEASWAVSQSGTLAYVPEQGAVDTGTLAWLGRDGRTAGAVVAESIEGAARLRISPDGTRVAVTTGGVVQGAGSLSVYDVAGRPPIPLLQGVGVNDPVWSPDGTRLAFQSGSPGQLFVYILPADGSGQAPERVETGAPLNNPSDWLAGDGLVVSVNGDLQVVPVDRDGAARDLFPGEDGEGEARVSPDGRWVAYTSNRSGSGEVWVRAVAAGAPVRVSQGGGRQPVWSRDGRELFYLRGNTITAARVTAGGDVFRFDVPKSLVELPFDSSLGPFSYDVAADGRFLITLPATPGPAPERAVVVVQNFFEELKRLVPTR